MEISMVLLRMVLQYWRQWCRKTHLNASVDDIIELTEAGERWSRLRSNIDVSNGD